MNAAARRVGVEDRVVINRVGSILTPFFTAGPVRTSTTRRSPTSRRSGSGSTRSSASGVFVAPAQFEAMFVSTAHTPRDVAATVKAHETALRAAFGSTAGG